MLNDRIKTNFNLHLLIFIWGFTSIFGELISLSSLHLVWHRIGIAIVILFVYLAIFHKSSFRIKKRNLKYYILGGALISSHWILFFYSIKISSIAIALATLSSASLMASLLEPLFYKRRIRKYELFFGAIAILGLSLIFNSEIKYINGIIIGLISTLLSVLFSLLNAALVTNNDAKTITFYELFIGFIFISLGFLIFPSSAENLFIFKNYDFLWLFILASVCTVYAFTSSVNLMKKVSPYTLLLTLNLEPIYGIFFAIIIFGDSQVLTLNFYIGLIIIILSVFINQYIKFMNDKKKEVKH